MFDSLKYKIIEENKLLPVISSIKDRFPQNTYLGEITTMIPTMTYNSLCAMFSGNLKLDNLIDKYLFDNP